MGRAYNPGVDIELKQAGETDMIAALRGPFSAGHFEDGFALAYIQDPTQHCRLSWVVIGTSAEAVQEYLEEKTGPDIAPGMVTNALEGLSTVFRLTKAAYELEQFGGPGGPSAGETAGLDDGVPRGCCSKSSGVSVLLVNKPDGSSRYRQVLLTDKFVACDIEQQKGFITQMAIIDDPPADHKSNPGPCV